MKHGGFEKGESSWGWVRAATLEARCSRLWGGSESKPESEGHGSWDGVEEWRRSIRYRRARS